MNKLLTRARLLRALHDDYYRNELQKLSCSLSIVLDIEREDKRKNLEARVRTRGDYIKLAD